jgi:hypothetical protein
MKMRILKEQVRRMVKEELKLRLKEFLPAGPESLAEQAVPGSAAAKIQQDIDSIGLGQRVFNTALPPTYQQRVILWGSADERARGFPDDRTARTVANQLNQAGRSNYIYAVQKIRGMLVVVPGRPR